MTKGLINLGGFYFISNFFPFSHLPGPVCPCHHPHRPDLFHGGLQLPIPNFPVHHYELRMHLPATVSEFLVPCLYQGSEVAQNYAKWKLQNEDSLKD